MRGGLLPSKKQSEMGVVVDIRRVARGGVVEGAERSQAPEIIKKGRSIDSAKKMFRRKNIPVVVTGFCWCLPEVDEDPVKMG